EAAAANGVARFILASTVKVYGESNAAIAPHSPRRPIEESVPCRPATPYGQAKLEAESLVLKGGYVPEPVVLRLSMVYGERAKGNLTKMIEAVAAGRFPSLPEAGNRRSMVHVEDVVQAALLAASCNEAIGEVFNVTDGRSYSSRELLLAIRRSLGKRPPSVDVPMGLLRLLGRIGDGIGALTRRRFVFDSDALDKLLTSAHFSSAKISKMLGYQPHWDLERALPSMIQALDLKARSASPGQKGSG
ncbi:MAG TPA: NAD-dependent epimerase/dehydratase family protein, partial [Acidobacteriota bacterium]|nr:NAD-dependent epimerase/dehydratase family protein [Acidobacteriota bacterium]